MKAGADAPPKEVLDLRCYSHRRLYGGAGWVHEMPKNREETVTRRGERRGRGLCTNVCRRQRSHRTDDIGTHTCRPTSCSSHLLLPVPLRQNTADQQHIPLREKGQEEVAWTGLRSKKRRRERKGKGPIGFTVVLYRPRYQKTTYTRISAKA